MYTGNPFLKPTITHNLKVGYSYRDYSFSLMLSRDKDPIARYQISQTASANLLYISPQNLDWQNNNNLQATVPLKINNWWNSTYSFTGGWRRFSVSHTLQPVGKSYPGYSFNFSEVFTLPGKYLVDISGWYNSIFYNGSIKIGSTAVLNLGVKK